LRLVEFGAQNPNIQRAIGVPHFTLFHFNSSSEKKKNRGSKAKINKAPPEDMKTFARFRTAWSSLRRCYSKGMCACSDGIC
jgi:hypothetical protein